MHQVTIPPNRFLSFPSQFLHLYSPTTYTFSTSQFNIVEVVVPDRWLLVLQVGWGLLVGGWYCDDTSSCVEFDCTRLPLLNHWLRFRLLYHHSKGWLKPIGFSWYPGRNRGKHSTNTISLVVPCLYYFLHWLHLDSLAYFLPILIFQYRGFTIHSSH